MSYSVKVLLLIIGLIHGHEFVHLDGSLDLGEEFLGKDFSLIGWESLESLNLGLEALGGTSDGSEGFLLLGRWGQGQE